MVCALLNPVMFSSSSHISVNGPGELASLLGQIAKASTRPRYAFMVLGLIAEAAQGDGSTGPFVAHDGAFTPLRDWLCDALTPMGGRDPKRLALAIRIRGEFERNARLPEDQGAAQVLIDDEIRRRVRSSGKTNLSRAVSELVTAALIARHYQGIRVDHRNRGAQRHVVYTLAGPARCLLRQAKPPSPPRPQRQYELPMQS